MIAQLVIRGHYCRRNVTSAEKLSRYWSRVHSWDAGLSHVKFACEATTVLTMVETLRYGDTIAQLVTGGRHYRRGCRRNGGLAVNNIVVAIITLKVI